MLYYAAQVCLAVAVALTLWSGWEFYRDVWKQRVPADLLSLTLSANLCAVGGVRCRSLQTRSPEIWFLRPDEVG